VTRTIPIVFVIAADLVGSGLVASIAPSGGNVTGLSLSARSKASSYRLTDATVPAGHRR
jgi:ABC-type uncharacterized transport system substrate-binding protein